jgi:hypothetical protein
VSQLDTPPPVVSEKVAAEIELVKKQLESEQ